MKNLKLTTSVILLFILTASLSEVTAQSAVKFVEPAHAAAQEEKPYTYVEQMPEFKGGQDAFMKFMASNLKSPASGTDGTTYASFIVEKDGSLSNIEVVKSADVSMDKEVIQALKLTNGKWEPGKQNGRTVKVKLTLPVQFTASK